MAESQSVDRPKNYVTDCKDFLDAVRSLPSHKCSSASPDRRKISFGLSDAHESEVQYLEHVAEEYGYELHEVKGRISVEGGENYVARYVDE